MCDGLAGVRDTMRTLFYRKHLNNFRVTSSDKLLGWGEEADSFERMSLLWGTDPVHLSTAGYKVMAKKIMEVGLSGAAFTNAKEPKRRRQGGAGLAGSPEMTRPSRGDSRPPGRAV